MYSVQIPHPSLPIVLHCFEDATVGLSPTNKFKTIIEPSNAFTSLLDDQGLVLASGGEVRDYDYGLRFKYKEDELLLAWLQQQNFVEPKFQKE